MPILSLEDVSKDYLTDGERVHALRGVSLDVDASSFVALVGRSGCGKSTLLNLAGAMDFPSAGRVILEGVETSALDEAGLTQVRRQKVGFIFQSFQLIQTLTVLENVELPLLLSGRTDGAPLARERLADVGLSGLERRLPHQLSGGQMQRVAIARALVHSPRLLLADEPTGNLDSATGNSILDLLRRLPGDHAPAVVMATHSRRGRGAGRCPRPHERRLHRRGATAVRAWLILFARLIVRPMLREKVRTTLTVLAVALGVAVVLAIELAGQAAVGSFQASVESLAGDMDLEVVAVGGVPEEVVGRLATLPYPMRVVPRMEEQVRVMGTYRAATLLGVDVIAAGSGLGSGVALDGGGEPEPGAGEASAWVTAAVGARRGDRLSILVNAGTATLIVRGVIGDDEGGAAVVLVDIDEAQEVLRRRGRVDRILVDVPGEPALEEWRARLATAVPPGVQVRARGAGTEENRKMLAAFRWNLRILSYIALVVGAFLIYNTISVSVVRRRPEIGILRALGASRRTVLAAFLLEAGAFGAAGAVVGLPLGRLMASGAVGLMASTVQSLYVSSRPGPIEFTTTAVALSVLSGLGIAVLSAVSPAREASLVAPHVAMARGERESATAVHRWRDLAIGAGLAAGAAVASRAPAVGGKPLFGYLAALLLIAASALAIPAVVHAFDLAVGRHPAPPAGRRGPARVPQPGRLAPPDLRARRRPRDRHRDDGRGRASWWAAFGRR